MKDVIRISMVVIGVAFFLISTTAFAWHSCYRDGAQWNAQTGPVRPVPWATMPYGHYALFSPPPELSDTYVVTTVRYCEEDERGEEVCRPGIMKASSVETNRTLLPRVAERRGLARGYQVTATFERRPSGLVAVTLVANPRDPYRRKQTFTASGRTTVEALGKLLTP